MLQKRGKEKKKRENVNLRIKASVKVVPSVFMFIQNKLVRSMGNLAHVNIGIFVN